MAKYVSLINLQLGSFTAWWLEKIPISSNRKADALAVIAASLPIREVLLPVYYQPESSITTNRVNEVDEAVASWMTTIVRYLSSGELPDDETKADKIQVQVARFSLVNEQLYKRSLGGPYLQCLTQQQRQYILVELYEGICENHLSGKTLAHRAHTQGYYWPTKWTYAAAYVKKCDHCQ